MTEQEILAELAANDLKIIRALCEKDDALIQHHNERQQWLRDELHKLTGQT